MNDDERERLRAELLANREAFAELNEISYLASGDHPDYRDLPSQQAARVALAHAQRTHPELHLDRYVVEQSSRDHVTFIDEAKKEAVVAERGTIFGTHKLAIRDMCNDADIVFGLEPRRVNTAAKEIERLQAAGYKVTVTGHSLGGRIAEALSLRYNIPCLSINAGRSPIELHILNLPNAARKYMAEEAQGKIVRVHVEGDLVSVWGLGRREVLNAKPGLSPHQLENARRDSSISGEEAKKLQEEWQKEWIREETARQSADAERRVAEMEKLQKQAAEANDERARREAEEALKQRTQEAREELERVTKLQADAQRATAEAAEAAKAQQEREQEVRVSAERLQQIEQNLANLNAMLADPNLTEAQRRETNAKVQALRSMHPAAAQSHRAAQERAGKMSSDVRSLQAEARRLGMQAQASARKHEQLQQAMQRVEQRRVAK